MGANGTNYGPQYTFLTNHGLVLSYIFYQPGHTVAEISSHIGITERTIRKIIPDMLAEVYIVCKKNGRRKEYIPNPEVLLRHNTKEGILESNILFAYTPKNIVSGDRSQQFPRGLALMLPPK